MTLSPAQGPSPATEDVFGPVRDQYLVAFLSTIRRIRQRDERLDVEPIRKSSGKILRQGILSLPERCDGAIGPHIPQSPMIVPVLDAVHTQPDQLIIADNLACTVYPFVWDDVWISATPPCASALLMRIRLWYLDWFQSRIVDSTDIVAGAVHRLAGPYEQEGAHWLHLDLGTAPYDALVTLLELLAAGDVRLCSVGGRPDFQNT